MTEQDELDVLRARIKVLREELDSARQQEKELVRGRLPVREGTILRHRKTGAGYKLFAPDVGNGAFSLYGVARKKNGEFGAQRRYIGWFSQRNSKLEEEWEIVA